MNRELVLGKINQEWYVTYPLPDHGSKYREKASKYLKARGCTIQREQRSYDIKNDHELMTVIGTVVEIVSTENLIKVEE